MTDDVNASDVVVEAAAHSLDDRGATGSAKVMRALLARALAAERQRDEALAALEKARAEISKGMTDHEGEDVPSHWRGLCEVFFPTAQDAAAFAKFVSSIRSFKDQTP